MPEFLWRKGEVVMDILIIAHFTQAPNEKGNGRFHYLADLLSEQKQNEHKVEI